MRVTCLLVAGLFFGFAAPAAAQVTDPADAPPPAVTPSEDIEPRVIGTTGTMSVGLAGYADRVTSEDDNLPLNVTLQVDVARFLTRRIAVRGGVVGTGALGGAEDDQRTGVGVPALNAFGAAQYYFTPQSMASFYGGVGYLSQITQRDGADRGFVLGLAGLEASVSSRAGVYVEGGYGFGLTRTDDDNNRRRMTLRLGFRLKL
jgi:hypothetical protein